MTGLSIQEARVHGPPSARDGDPVLLLLHGRGSSEADLGGLASSLIRAVEAGSDGGRLQVVTPRAPWPGQPWAYGMGWAWYRYLGEDRPEPDTLAATLEALDRFIDDLPERLGREPGPLVLGGFSQGGTTSLAWSLTRKGQAAGAANLSGFLAQVPLVQKALIGARDFPVFWGHGRMDPAIPHSLAEKGRRVLEEAGADLEIHDHEGGHTITPSEVAGMAGWLGGVISKRPPER